MPYSAKGRRIDNNQNDLVRQIRSIPKTTVAITSGVGAGFPDIVVGYRGKNYLLEIKDPRRKPSERRLTPDEQDFVSDWCGQVDVVETIDDVIKVINRNV